MGQGPAEDIHKVVRIPRLHPGCQPLVLINYHRLNSKLKARELEINDLILDLSDGVSILPTSFGPSTPFSRSTPARHSLFTN